MDNVEDFELAIGVLALASRRRVDVASGAYVDHGDAVVPTVRDGLGDHQGDHGTREVIDSGHER